MRGKRVYKPRTLGWERLVLSASSPLRRQLDAIAAEEGRASTFAFLPDLGFEVGDREGEVDAIQLDPLPRMNAERRDDLASVAGRALALFAWLGVSDLHWENLALGAAADGRTILAPLDVEIILSDLALPTETQLLAAADAEDGAAYAHAAGLRRVLAYLGKPVRASELLRLLAGYRGVLHLLDRHRRAIADVLAGQPELAVAPIRVCLRGTADYTRALSDAAAVWPPLLEAESVQLERGDIPYFFRLYGQRGIRYYTEPSLTRVASIPARGEVPRLPPLLSVGRALASPSRARLRELGLLTTLGAFDHPSFTGTHTLDGPDALSVQFDAREMRVWFDDGEDLACPRDLRSVVESIYRPCRCGEVLSVLVPARTRCSAA